MSFISHMTFGTNDLARSKRFYDAAMGALGLKQVHAGPAFVAYGRAEAEFPWLWVMPPYDGLPATWGNGTHCSFMVESRAMVEAFHAAALANGGSDEGGPGLRPRYSDSYYAAYVRDPDGNKLQALTYRGEGEVEPYPQVFSHITLGTNDRARSKVFYDAVMAPLGLRVIDEDEMAWGYGVAGEDFPVLYTHETFDGRPATWGNGSHVALLAPSRGAVAAFHEAGLAQGGLDEGAPGLRPHYGENYFGAYLRDLDGNKLQAVCYAAAQ
jgi:catechol 2,3-dioxygenase-like lactoylglutathione lyase family enzyme